MDMDTVTGKFLRAGLLLAVFLMAVIPAGSGPVAAGDQLTGFLL